MSCPASLGRARAWLHPINPINQQLDFCCRNFQNQQLVLPIVINFYSQWRARTLPIQGLQESLEGLLLNEHLLQLIWQHQRIQREQLTTVDGSPLRILHPGFWNHESGPDFRDAIVQFGSAPAVSGDVEIDLCPQGWHSHGHDINPNYRRVILHVVWDADAKNAPVLPTLSLKSILDAPLTELDHWLSNGALESIAPGLAGQCCAPLQDLPTDLWREILRQAAQVRLQTKAVQFQARAREVGWEQALWEGLFGALGYKHNIWPMRRLAELISFVRSENGAGVIELQARLLGLSGLLPHDLLPRRRSSGDYLRQLWDIWWREREAFSSLVLPQAMWRLGGLRPANHPQRRLALAAHWLNTRDWPAKLEAWFRSSIPDKQLLSSLTEVLQVPCDGFWSWHWTLGSRRMKAPQPLLGPARATDLAVNVILPWFWMRAVAGKNDRLQEAAEHRYFIWPKAQDNAVLRLARQRLFGGAKASEIGTAAAQQGLLQIVRDFCQHSNALCENCRFPELVRKLRSSL